FRLARGHSRNHPGARLTPLSHLFVGRLEFTRIGPLLFRQHATFGPWFPIHRAYSYLLVGISLLLFIIQIIRSSDFYRRQALLIFLGILLAASANAIANLTV